MLRRSFLLAVMLLAHPVRSQADVQPVGLFGSHMVLQREMPVPVWGTAAAGEQVTVKFGDQTVSTTAGADGKWKVQLPALPASSEPRVLTISGANTLTYEDVLVGDVWVCSGQSNMELAPSRGFRDGDREKEIAAANHPLIRLITLNKVVASGPLSDVKGTWGACTPQSMPRFSAAGYICGRDIHQQTGVPVGLIGMYYGGSNNQSWTRREALLSDPDLAGNVAQSDADAARGGGRRGRGPTPGGEPPPPVDPNAPPVAMSPGTSGAASRYRASNFYNGMAAPTMPFAIKGVLWYQGEAETGNVRNAGLFKKLFPLMIADWRQQWGQGDFPFIFVQLPPCQPKYPDPTDSAWARARESQQQALQLPHVHMAVTIELAQGIDVHAANKLEIGQRLAALALHHVYGKKELPCEAPQVDKVEFVGAKAALTFKNTDGGLVVKHPEGLKGFALAGADQKYVWASAEIQGDKVIVSSPEVSSPVAVRYGWADNPDVGLFNGAGFPAAPYRSDDWPPTNVTNPRAAP